MRFALFIALQVGHEVDGLKHPYNCPLVRVIIDSSHSVTSTRYLMPLRMS